MWRPEFPPRPTDSRMAEIDRLLSESTESLDSFVVIAQAIPIFLETHSYAQLVDIKNTFNPLVGITEQAIKMLIINRKRAGLPLNGMVKGLELQKLFPQEDLRIAIRHGVRRALLPATRNPTEILVDFNKSAFN